jgi:hypothetical protein
MRKAEADAARPELCALRQFWVIKHHGLEGNHQ